jgi:shikimate kinase
MVSEHVVLVGLMGSGKSTVGRELAVLLGRPFIDNDEQVRAATGRSVAEISLAEGVSEMRRLESEALAQALAWPVPAVITAAAGTILDEQVRRRLREPFVVWLRAEPATLARRVTADPLRPFLGDQPEGVLHTMDQERSALYAEVADLSVSVDALAPADVAASIAARLSQRSTPSQD